MSLFRTGVAAVALAVCATGAHAAQVKFTGFNPGSTGVSGISSTTYGGVTGFATNASAGAFNAQQTSGSLGNGIQNNFIAFCLDLVGRVSIGASAPNYEYNVTTEPFVDGRVLTARQKWNIEAVFDKHYSNDVVSSTVNSSAFQLALWEAAYETGNSLNIQDGDFKITSLGGLLAQTTAYLTGLADFVDDETDYVASRYKTNFLDAVSINPDIQDMATATVVPLPAAGLLLVGALGALGYTSRRRKAASEA